MIKYLGSKRRLVPLLGELATTVQATTALDLFTGTTRVAQEFKRRGLEVHAADIATYAEVLADCYIRTDLHQTDTQRLERRLRALAALPPRPGYFTEVFCERSRYIQPKNGARIDAIREELAAGSSDDPLLPILLTSLMLAADRVDSTTGLQMAYLKQWAPRSHNELELRAPELIAGSGHTYLGDAVDLVQDMPTVDLAYLDPPYNQHRYFTNYHVWESLIRWDKPDHYGVACKRVDSRADHTKSTFNRKKEMPTAFTKILNDVSANTVVVSYNNESWMTADQIESALTESHECVTTLAVDSKRYVGAQIGIHDPNGNRVGSVSHTRNLEYIFVAGRAASIRAVQDRFPHLLHHEPAA